MNVKELRRGYVTVRGHRFPALKGRRHSYLFINGEVVPVPTPLLRWPQAVAWLLHEHLQPAPKSSFLSVTVIPQMHCNAACPYCIQNLLAEPNGVVRVASTWMTDATITAVAAFVEQQRIAHGVRSVAVTLFGGEPLVNAERCYRLLEAIEHRHHNSIITNGVLLTPKVATRLTELGVKDVQITFDGAREDHDAVRMLAANGGGTYDTILTNLAEIDTLPVLPLRQIRVNVTRRNLPGLERLVHDLASKLDPSRWVLYFAIVEDNNIGWQEGLQPQEAFGARLASLARLAHYLGFRLPTPDASSKCPFCADSFGTGGIVVNADGRLYSCWDTAGFEDMAVGNVHDGYTEQAHPERWVACGYQACNTEGNEAQHAMLNWALREIAVASRR